MRIQKKSDKFAPTKMGKLQKVKFIDCNGNQAEVDYSSLKKEIHGNQICLVHEETGTLLSITRCPKENIGNKNLRKFNIYITYHYISAMSKIAASLDWPIDAPTEDMALAIARNKLRKQQPSSVIDSIVYEEIK